MQRVPRRQFTDDFKTQAVTSAGSVGAAKAARQLDMSVKTLTHWLVRARSGRPLSSSTRQPLSDCSATLHTIELRLRKRPNEAVIALSRLMRWRDRDLNAKDCARRSPSSSAA